MSHATGPTDPPLRDITLGQLLAWAAETTPDRVALIAGVADPAARRQWTYAELQAQALRTAKALRAHFEPGERVAVWAPNLPEWVMLEFGCALAGVVLVTVNPAFRAQELEYVLKQSRSAGVFVVEAFRGNPMHATVQQVARTARSCATSSASMPGKTFWREATHRASRCRRSSPPTR